MEDLFGNDDEKLKEFMQEHFAFSSLKKSGVFPKEMKSNDYEGQAKRICHMFSLESIYDYVKIGWGVRCHISYAHPNDFTPFVETINDMKHINSKPAKIINFNNG